MIKTLKEKGGFFIFDLKMSKEFGVSDFKW